MLQLSLKTTKFFTLSRGGGGVSSISIFHSFVFHSLSRGEGGKVNDAIFTKSAVFFLMSSLSTCTENCFFGLKLEQYGRCGEVSNT